ncbi:MAG: ParB N-terminal domain-containing protein [Gammaproteobacteria bacterium]|nr:ParB N-terminal domain-containing protein [Gammaproteobacteria bacterium]
MNIKQIPLQQIHRQQSLFRFRRSVGLDNEQTTLSDSLQRMGMLMPVLLYADRDGALHLVDGFQRLAYAAGQGWAEVPCRVLAAETSMLALVEIVLQEVLVQVEDNFIAKVRFIDEALVLGVTDEALQALLSKLSLESHPKVLRRLRAVAELPDEVLDFCAEKRFSMKQCFHISRHPAGLLKLVFSWRDQLFLTASLVMELCEDIKDYLRAEQVDTDTFARDGEVIALLQGHGSPQQKTKALRQLLRTRRNPVLTRVNSEMSDISNRLNLPTAVRISWDPTLEQCAIKCMVSVSSHQEWLDVVRRLHESDTYDAVQKLFEKI